MKRRAMIAVTTLGALALSLSACSSSSPAPNASGSEGGPYLDPDYGFQVTVEPGFAQGSQHNVAFAATADVPAARNVMFYDTKDVISHSAAPSSIPGAQAISKQIPSGTSMYPATFTVSVFPLGEAVTASNLAAAKAELQQHVMTNLAQEGATPGPLQDATVAGRPAFTTELKPSANQSGLNLQTKIYWVFAEQDQYQITEQAPVTQWQEYQKPFDTMLSSVVLPGTWASATPSPSSSPSATTASESASPTASTTP